VRATAERASRKASFIRVHHAKMEESEVAHGAGGGADVEGIARTDEDDA